MGGAGTDVALETAGVVLVGDDLTKLPYAVDLSRRTRRIILQNLGFSLTVILTLVTLVLTVGIPLPVGVIGHEGSTIIVVSSKAERALLLGDVVHCPVELLDEEWAGMGDVDPELAKRTRNAMARELEGSDVPAAAAHFPGLQFGKLLAGNGKRQWVID